MKQIMLLRSVSGVPLLIAGVLAMLLMGMDFCHRDTESTEIEIVIVRAPGQPRHPYQTEYEQMLYPTVRITAGYSTGSGVVISNTNHTNKDEWTRIDILTAAHVVENESGVDIEFYNSEVITGTVVITDTVKDLALIRVICSIRDIRYRGLCGVRVKDIYSASLAPENYQAYLFTPVWAVGCSLGLNPRPSSGHITAVNNDSWEVSSPILPGNSGGPVYDARTYEVIGIAVWVKVYDGQLITTMAGVVPITEIYNFLENHFPAKAGSKNQ